MERFQKKQQRKGLTSILDCVIPVAKGSNCKVSDHSNLQMLSYKQMLQRLPLVLAQVKAGNTYEDLIIYSLYRAKQITKKVYNNVMNSINL